MLTSFRFCGGPVLRFCGALLAASSLLSLRSAHAGFDPPAAFLERHCVDCHSGPEGEGGLDLQSLDGALDQPAVMAKWVRIFDRVSQGEMPPKEGEQPAAVDRKAFLSDLGLSLKTVSAQHAHTVLRRLNRMEYEHTLNDLLEIRESLTELLPEDGHASGFDNVGSALDLSSIHLQRYMAAAGQAIDAAIQKEPRPERTASQHNLAEGRNAENLGKHWLKRKDGAVVVFNNGGFPRPTLSGYKAPHEGRYRITVSGSAHQSEEPVACELWQGTFGRDVVTEKVADLRFASVEEQQYQYEVWLKPGATFLFLPRLTADFAKLRDLGPEEYPGRGLAVHDVKIEGPLIDEWPGRGHRLLFGELPIREKEPSNPRLKQQKNYRPEYEIISENPAADAERLLRNFLPLAFRRPVTPEEIAPLLSLAQTELAAGADFESAMRTAYIAALCSPHFLYLREPAGTLDDYALAARLSYAFWNTLPDAELRQLAEQGELSRPDVLRAQTERLLADPRAERFIATFTGQWLNLREIDFTMPDQQLYPEFDDSLKSAMVTETERFFAEVLRSDLSVLNFLDSDWTMLNERLARHYRIDGVEGDEFRRVALQPDHHRGGVLTHGSVLKVSANGTTTSPVIRGVFVLERILGEEPPPPPPGVPGVEPDIRGSTTLREQLEKHRAIVSCNNCHKIIDPPGFSLENYDVAGGWRENYRSLGKDFPAPPPELHVGSRNVKWRVGPKVDATGTTPEGKAFSGLEDYKRILLSEPDRFTRAFSGKIAVYLTGREMGFADRQELARISQAAAADGYRFRELIHQIVQSELFRNK